MRVAELEWRKPLLRTTGNSTSAGFLERPGKTGSARSRRIGPLAVEQPRNELFMCSIPERPGTRACESTVLLLSWQSEVRFRLFDDRLDPSDWRPKGPAKFGFMRGRHRS